MQAGRGTRRRSGIGDKVSEIVDAFIEAGARRVVGWAYNKKSSAQFTYGENLSAIRMTKNNRAAALACSKVSASLTRGRSVYNFISLIMWPARANRVD